MSKSIMQTERECYITGDIYGLEVHHIFRGKNRKNADRYGCWVFLRHDWHRGESYAVHGNGGHELDMRLKKECQEKFEAIHGREMFVRVFGRNYLEE